MTSNKQLMTAEIARSLSSFQETLRLVCQVDMGGFGFVNPDGSILLSGPTGRKTNALLGLELPQGRGLGWTAVEKGKPWQLNDYISSSEIRHDNYADQAVALEGIKASFAAPLYHDSGVIGVIYGWSRNRGGFSPDQLTHINAFAEVISKNEQIGVHLAHNPLSFKELVQTIDFYMGADSDLLAYYDYVVESAMSGNDPGSILNKLTVRLQNPLILVSHQLVIQACAGCRISGTVTRVEGLNSVPAALQCNIPGLVMLTDRTGKVWMGVPIRGSAGILGYIGILAKKAVPLRDMKLVKASCMALALLEQHETGEGEIGQELKRKLMEELFTSTRSSEGAIVTKAKKMGLDLLARNKLIVLAVHDQPISKKLYFECLKLLLHKQNSFCGMIDKHMILIMPNRQEEESERFLKALFSALGRDMGTEALLGITAICNKFEDYSRNYREICSILELWPPTGFSNQMMDLENIGPKRLFLHPANQVFLEHYVQEILGALLSHDKKKGSNLTSTLECYFDTNCLRKETAQRLYIHEHTLDYRLRKIQELLTIDLDEYTKRFHIHFALEALKTLRIMGLVE
ncbi:MAG: helix-turn-helix domain-containing protein [Desulfitobacteriaceae bacterium]|nr:helix-turn-helix domain-containing protein [Desulfitobacteriaceae bacterium]